MGTHGDVFLGNTKYYVTLQPFNGGIGGLSFGKLVGPGKVIMQTQNFYDFAQRVIALVPRGN